jgi:hypothetical protein
MLTFKNFMKSIDISDTSTAKPVSKRFFGRNAHRAIEDEQEQAPNIPAQNPEDQQPPEQAPATPKEQPPTDIGAPTSEDPNRQGLIRTVKGAHLVYKRKDDTGTFSELWIYPIDQKGIRTEMQIRRDILAGTDIPEKQVSSDDGSQELDLWTAGNAQLILITGLPN